MSRSVLLILELYENFVSVCLQNKTLFSTPISLTFNLLYRQHKCINLHAYTWNLLIGNGDYSNIFFAATVYSLFCQWLGHASCNILSRYLRMERRKWIYASAKFRFGLWGIGMPNCTQEQKIIILNFYWMKYCQPLLILD